MTEEKLSAKQRFKLKHFIKELELFKGRHTELISVYIPSGYDLNKIMNHLFQEQGTASNIKSKATKDNVQTGLEKMMQHLKLFKRTPQNGLAIFSGNVAEREGQQDFNVWSIEPPFPLKQRLYRCDKDFMLDPLREQCENKNVYGLVVMDKREGNVALLKGKTIIPLNKAHSAVPGKTRAGGQCLISSSLIQLSDGSLPKIEIVHNPNIVKSMEINNNSIRNSNIIDKWNTKKQVCIIITKNPRFEIQTSKDHTFFVSTNDGIIEKRADELKKEDLLVMPEKIDVKSKKQKLNSKKYFNAFSITKEGQKYLKKKRLGKSLDQKQLAKKVGLTQTGISIFELGKRNAKRSTLKKICEELNIHYQTFLKKYTQEYLYRNIRLPFEIDDTFAQFLGYLIGDGCIETDRITFFEQREGLALNYKKKFDNYFGIDSSYRFRKDKNYHQLRFTSRPLVRLILEEFLEIKKSGDTLIPQKILQSNDLVVAAFLKGLFDAEGYVNVSRGVGLSMNNKSLIQQIQMVLLRFSILSSMNEYDNRANKYSNNPRFTIDITEKKSLEFFKRNIGFGSVEKTKKLNTLINRKSNVSYTRQIITSGSKVRKIIEEAGYNLELFPKVSNFFNDKRMMSKEIFKNSIMKNIKDKKLFAKLRKVYENPLLPVQIKEIKRTKKVVDMIDISVKNQNFIANGLFVHNSAARFERLREGAAKDFYKKIADLMKSEFLDNKNLKGIIVGGPGHTKNEFVDGNYITDQLKRKIIGLKDLSYTGEFGLQELLDKSEDLLAEEDVVEEKKIMQKFFGLLAKQSGIVNYGREHVMDDLKMGVVDTVLLSEELDNEVIDEFEKEAENRGSLTIIISTDTREGVQLRDLGKVAAILRYEVQR